MQKILNNYSINFNTIKRKKEKIKYLVFHYTGMKSEKLAIRRLKDKKSKVSCHYFIKKNGTILNMVPESYISWHAGISNWKKYDKINKNSIGIEIQNPGHKNNYSNFSIKQIRSIEYLSKKLIKKFNLNKKNFLGHSDVSPDRKKDPGEKFPWKALSKHEIGIWHNLDNNLLQRIRSKKIDRKQKILFLKRLIKIGYFLKKKKLEHSFLVIKAFQRRFRPQIINGKIDLECCEIAKNLIKSGLN